ncbi:MAG: hypothetical protein ACYC35_06305 [Pirellulales bacterium]
MQWRLDSGQIQILEERVAASLRAMTPTQRVAMIFDANRTMRLRLEGRFRSRYPEWDDARIAAEIARRMSGGSG